MRAIEEGKQLDHATGESSLFLVSLAQLFPLLLSRGRWREAGLLLANPVQMDPSLAGGNTEVEDGRRRVVQKMAAEMCAALSAASRDDEARAVEREAQTRVPGDEMKRAIAEARRAAEQHRPVDPLL